MNYDLLEIFINHLAIHTDIKICMKVYQVWVPPNRVQGPQKVELTQHCESHCTLPVHLLAFLLSNLLAPPDQTVTATSCLAC